MGIGFFNLRLSHLTMRAVSRGIVYSLMAVVLILLVGIAALISVANHRHQRLEDTTIDLQRNLSQQERKIRDLQQRLENCDTMQAATPVDSSWSTSATIESTSVAKKAIRPRLPLQ